MSPLPCSPVSNSTTSHAATSEEDMSDASLTTPRPGPSDEAQRTSEKLSLPSLPSYTIGAGESSTAKELGSGQSDTTLIQRAEVSSITSLPSPGTSSPTSAVHVPERQRSVTFQRQSTSTKKKSIYGSVSSMPRASPAISPGADAREPLHEEEHAAESSADENTAIFRRENRQYGAVDADGRGADAWEESSTARKRNVGKAKDTQSNTQEDVKRPSQESWWKKTLIKYGSVELENKGSVARDHLALERTFLAWLRTSLSFASIGIAVTQLFRLNTSLSDDSDGTQKTPAANLKQVGKPLGATFLGISILILLLGFHRYFESQHYVIRGKFPASRATIVLVSLVAGGLIVASLTVVLAIAPTAFET